MSLIRPLVIGEVLPPRPLGDSLAQMPSHEVTSPWTPRPIEVTPAAASTSQQIATHVPIETIEAQARERGRAEGLAETAALRAKLAATLEKLEMGCAEVHALASTQIADAVVAVISTWTERADRAELFAPVIQGWLAAGSTGPGPRAHVHPTEVEAMKSVLGDVAIPVVADPTQKPGDLAIRGETLELLNRWDDRLADLREQVAMWLDHEAGEGA